MGFADRDYAHARQEGERVFSAPEPSALSTLWIILFWGVMALACYRAITWWQQGQQQARTPPPAASAQPAAPPSAPGRAEPAARQSPAQASRQLPPAPPTAEQPGSVQPAQVTKCVVKGLTTYTDQPCPSNARAVAVNVNPAVNVVDRVPASPAALPLPEAIAQGAPPPAAPAEAPEQWKKRVCAYHDDAIKWIDARARQPLSAWEQDDLAARRKKHRDEQYRLRCQ